MFKKVPTIWIVIIAAISISFLANIRLITQIYSLMNEEALISGKARELKFLINLSIKDAISEFITFTLIVLLNYSWKDRFIPKNVQPAGRFGLILFSNLLLLTVLSFADFTVERQLSVKAFADYNSYFPKNYLLKRIPILAIAFITPFLLLQRKKVMLAEFNIRRIKEEKAEAELAALKEQISPHFFFNTLSTLSTIVRNESKELGLEFIQDMSNTYRYTLTAANENLVALEKEIDFIQSYVYLLQKRFGEKLQFHLDISRAYLHHKIPPMALQLLVENAIQHNVITRKTPLSIRIFQENEHICVSNNLQPKSDVESFGTGLQNLSNRYQLLAEKEIVIVKDQEQFLVKLPLL